MKPAASVLTAAKAARAIQGLRATSTDAQHHETTVFLGRSLILSVVRESTLKEHHSFWHFHI